MVQSDFHPDLVLIGVLLIMLLSALPAIRRINRLNLAEATKMIT